MLFQGLLNLLLWLFGAVLTMLEIPTFELDVAGIVAEFVAYIAVGVKILKAYTPYTFMLVLLGIVILIRAFEILYHFIMWILRKLPFVNIN